MDHRSQPLVSVVTPVYNTGKYLAECAESILAQTYENWEYVIVNNGSTDDSLEIAQRYAQQDARIRIHDNAEFLSQMQNWNHALRQISPDSKYCKVVHADDWLFPECISAMVTLAEAHPSVGIVGAYRLDETQVNLDGLPYPSVVTPGREICRSTLLGDLYVFGSPTSLLIRSDFIQGSNAFYDEHVIQADKKVCLDILQSSDFGFVHQVLTYTRRHNESITSLIHRLDTRRLGRLNYLAEYGPVFLDAQEYNERWERALESHYRFLAQSVFERRGKEFWHYHKDGLEKLGHPLRRGKLAKTLFLALLNLKDTFGRTRQTFKGRKDRDLETPEAVLGSIYVEKDDQE